MKICSKCNIEKQLTEFYKSAKAKFGVSSYCKTCTCDYAKQKRRSNPTLAKELQRAYNRANTDKRAAYAKKYYENNTEKVAEAAKKWQSENLDRCAAIMRNRRARVINSGGSHTAKDIESIFSAQRGMCANCLCKLFKSGKKKFHVDHVMPLARGGSNDRLNLQCLCPNCNFRKNAKDPIKWAQQNGRLI